MPFTLFVKCIVAWSPYTCLTSDVHALLYRHFRSSSPACVRFIIIVGLSVHMRQIRVAPLFAKRNTVLAEIEISNL